MKWKLNNVLTSILLVILFSIPTFAEEQNKLETFFSAPTGQAQALRLQFSDTELEEIWENYKSSLPVIERRRLWLLEEYQQREQQRIAGDRVFYLTIALISLVFMFFVFVFILFRVQQKTASEITELRESMNLK